MSAAYNRIRMLGIRPAFVYALSGIGWDWAPKETGPNHHVQISFLQLMTAQRLRQPLADMICKPGGQMESRLVNATMPMSLTKEMVSILTERRDYSLFFSNLKSHTERLNALNTEGLRLQEIGGVSVSPLGSDFGKLRDTLEANMTTIEHSVPRRAELGPLFIVVFHYICFLRHACSRFNSDLRSTRANELKGILASSLTFCEFVQSQLFNAKVRPALLAEFDRNSLAYLLTALGNIYELSIEHTYKLRDPSVPALNAIWAYELALEFDSGFSGSIQPRPLELRSRI